MRVLVLGDTHGNADWATKAVLTAHRWGIKTIVQVGDFGLWDHYKDGVKFLDTLNEALRLRGVKMYVLGGNHENWDRWDWYTENNPKDYHRFSYLRSHIRIAPKVHSWVWNGKRCTMVGGAVSIDKAWRTPGRSWWPKEELTWNQAEDAKRFVATDYLFTHDCSNKTPFHGRLKPDLDSQAHRHLIDGVLAAVKPKLHFHGHMHTKYDWVNMVDVVDGEPVYTQTYGLECDGMYSSWGVLDVDSGEFHWPGKGMLKELPQESPPATHMPVNDDF